VIFGSDYAAAYDDLYSSKDYSAECDLLERVFNGHVRKVLDLGCGTGNHSVVLAERGYDVVGIDGSEDMLRRARVRGGGGRFEHGDVRHLDLDETFDAVLMMFAVLGYQTQNGDIDAALSTARKHLQSGGLFFGDVWYGPAVLAQRPSDRVKVIETPAGGQVIRVAGGELDVLRNVCSVAYHLWRIENGRVCAEVREQHQMRYFFAPEVQLVLEHAGFELVRIGAFPDFDNDPTEQTWNVAFLARAA
jgi:SAM-dependent methyltransferase